MFALVSLALLAASAVAHPLRNDLASRHHVLAARKAEPSGWFHDYLENYDVYHTRYLALNCQDQHNSDFFARCCHPMLATETLDKNRDADCKPGAAASSSAAAAEPTSTVTTEFDDGDEDCEDDDEPAASPSPSPSPLKQAEAKPSPAPQSSAAPKPADTPKPSAAPKPADTPKPSEAPKPAETPKETPSKAAPAPPKDTDKGGNDGQNNNGGGNSNNGAKPFTGQVTFYDQEGGTGACGQKHSDSDLIGAMNTEQYQSLNPCGKNVLITANNGKTVTIAIQDECPGCAKESIDLSRGAFEKLAAFDVGVVPVSWVFV